MKRHKYGELIRRYRRKHSISQLDLECAAGLSFGTISRIEKGKNSPSKETLYKISEVLDLSQIEMANLFGLEIGREFIKKVLK